MPLTTDISTYIQANIATWISPNNGTNANGNIFESFLPDLPDRAVAVYEMPGTKPQRGLGNTYAWENCRLRVVNRAPVGTAGVPTSGSWPMAYSDAEAIWNLLRVVNNQTVNGIKYILIDPTGRPAPQVLDPNNRPSYAQEFSVMKYMSD